MWEQIAVQIAVVLILQRLRESDYGNLADILELEAGHAAKKINTIEALEHLIKVNTAIEKISVQLGAELTANVLKIGSFFERLGSKMSLEGNTEYDRGFLEGSKAQNEAVHKYIIKPLEAKIKRLKEAINEYGGHKASCKIYKCSMECTCGFEQAP